MPQRIIEHSVGHEHDVYLARLIGKDGRFRKFKIGVEHHADSTLSFSETTRDESTALAIFDNYKRKYR